MQKSPIVLQDTLHTDYVTTVGLATILTVKAIESGWYEIKGELDCSYSAGASSAGVVTQILLNATPAYPPRIWILTLAGAGVTATVSSSLNWTDSPIYLTVGDTVNLQVVDAGAQHATVLGTTYKSNLFARYL